MCNPLHWKKNPGKHDAEIKIRHEKPQTKFKYLYKKVYVHTVYINKYY